MIDILLKIGSYVFAIWCVIVFGIFGWITLLTVLHLASNCTY